MPAKQPRPKTCSSRSTPTLWEDRGDLPKLNLFLGVGSREGQPKPPFKFDKEDTSGTNPKIKVIDANGVKWNIKWTWNANPFVGSKELSGLQVLATMLNNWDMKPTNNNVLGMYDKEGKVVDYYVVADWGGSFGKMSAIFTFSKWNLDDYNKQGFIDGVSGDRLKLHYRGRSQSLFKSVPVEHAKWFAGIVGQLTDDQLRGAFRAAEDTPAEIEGFTKRVRQKINELKAAVGR